MSLVYSPFGAASPANPRPHIEQDDLDQDIASIKAKIGSSAFEVAYDAGRKMILDEAVALALDTNDNSI